LLAAVVEPDRFNRLILLNASPRYLDDAGYQGGLTEGELHETYARIRENYVNWVLAFAPAVTASDGPGLSEFARGLLELRVDVALAVLRSIYEADLRDLLPQIICPVEIMQSRNDIAVPVEVGAYLAHRLPNGHLHVLETQGHLPHLTTPERIWPVLDKFLGGGG
jgi:sigma-B regulation protein RsbQ